MGDIHGDLTKAIALFKLAGVVEERDRRVLWIGGDTTVIQLGDVLDRGSREIGGPFCDRPVIVRQCAILPMQLRHPANAASYNCHKWQ